MGPHQDVRIDELFRQTRRRLCIDLSFKEDNARFKGGPQRLDNTNNVLIREADL
jgi:hypothetical protein